MKIHEIAELFQTTKQSVSKHIKAIFLEGELEERETVNFKLTVQEEGKRRILLRGKHKEK